MLFTEIDQPIHHPVAALYVSQLIARQSLIQKHIRGLIVIVHHARHRIGACGCQYKVLFCLFRLSQRLFRKAEIIVNIVIPAALQFSFAKIIRIDKRLFQQFLRLPVILRFHPLFRHLCQRPDILCRCLPMGEAF